MSVSLYQSSIPVLAKALRSSNAILDKAIAFAAEKQANSSPSLNVEQGLVQARLMPDMFPYARQIQIATDLAKGCAARLSGIDPPKYEDNETTLAELKARIEKTVAFIESVDRKAVDASVERQINLKVGGREMSFNGCDYLSGFVLPNVYFHLTMAYALLRQAGLGIGKQDFLGA